MVNCDTHRLLLLKDYNKQHKYMSYSLLYHVTNELGFSAHILNAYHFSQLSAVRIDQDIIMQNDRNYQVLGINYSVAIVLHIAHWYLS